MDVQKNGNGDIEFLDVLGTELDRCEPKLMKIWIFKRCKVLIGESCRTEFKISRKMKV